MKQIDLTERQVRDALRSTATATAAAVSLGISRRTLYRLIERHGIELRRVIG